MSAIGAVNSRRQWRRCRAAGVPIQIGFATKNETARQQVTAAPAASTPRGIVLSDAAYGDEAGFQYYAISSWTTSPNVSVSL